MPPQNSLLSSLANEFLNAYSIKILFFYSLLGKNGKRFGKKSKQMRETIKNKMAPLKVPLHLAFFFFCFSNQISILHFFFG
jgi:hypothetical protein